MSKTFAFINPETGDVRFTQTVGNNVGWSAGQIVGDSLLIDISDDQENEKLYATSKYYDNGWKDKPTRPGDYYNWSTSGWVFDSDRLFSKIRSDRNSLLTQSDWTQLPDAPLTDAQKTEWSTYRQALRDVPLNNSNVTSLDEVVWPTQPTV